jgi:hypothetical protein
VNNGGVFALTALTVTSRSPTAGALANIPFKPDLVTSTPCQ